MGRPRILNSKYAVRSPSTALLKNKNLKSWKKFLLSKEVVPKRQRTSKKTRMKRKRKGIRRRRRKKRRKRRKKKKKANKKGRPKISKKKKRSHFLLHLLKKESQSKSIAFRTTMLTSTLRYSIDLTSPATILRHWSVILTHLWLRPWKCVKLRAKTAAR